MLSSSILEHSHFVVTVLEEVGDMFWELKSPSDVEGDICMYETIFTES